MSLNSKEVSCELQIKPFCAFIVLSQGPEQNEANRDFQRGSETNDSALALNFVFETRASFAGERAIIVLSSRDGEMADCLLFSRVIIL